MINRVLNSRQIARLLAALLVAGTLLLYLATLHPGFASGESARRVTMALGRASYTEEVVKTRMPRLPTGMRGAAGQVSLHEVVWSSSTQHRLWGVISRIVSRLPLGCLSWRMNLLSALCGSLGVGLIFALVRSLVLLFSFYVSAVPALRRKTVANLAGLASAMTLATAVPYWLAATRSLPHTFDTLMLLLMGWLILRALIRHREWPLIIYGILQGLMIFESDMGLLMFPLLLFFALRAIRMGDIGYSGGMVAIISGLALGTFAYLLLTWLGNLGTTTGGSLALPLNDLGNTFKYFWKMFFGGWRGDVLWRIIFCFAVLPALIVIGMAIWGGADTPGSSNVVLILVLLAAMTVALTGSSISLWGAHRLLNTPAYPTVAFALAALVIGFITAQASMMAGGRLFPEVGRSLSRPRPRSAEPGATNPPLGRMIISYLAVFLLSVGLFNLREVLDWRDPLSCRVARESVRRFKDVRWIISDGSLDMLTRLYASQAGLTLSFITDSDTFFELPASAGERLQRDATFAGLDINMLQEATRGSNAVTVAQALVRLTPEADKRLRIAQKAELWEQAGYVAIPDVIGYRAAPGDTEVDWLALQQEHYAFWDHIELLPTLGDYAPGWLRGERAHIRAHLSAIGLRLADGLARSGHASAAHETARRAKRVAEEPLPTEADIFY